MFAKNGNIVIAVYGNSFLKLDRDYSPLLYMLKKKTYNFDTPLHKKYSKTFDNISINIMASVALDKNAIEFSANINDIGMVRFRDLQTFCLQENIHDFDIFFNTVLKGKLLIDYTEQEKDFFINTFGLEKSIFSQKHSVYVDNNIEYYYYKQKFYLYCETTDETNNYKIYSNHYNKGIPNNYNYKTKRVMLALNGSKIISQQEYEKFAQDNFLIICKDNYDLYYIYKYNKTIMVKLRNYYIKMPEDIFLNHYNKNITKQFTAQQTVLEKLKG